MGNFLKIDKVVQSLTAWFSLLGILTAGFGWVSSRLKFMSGFGWAEYFFVGLGTALLVLLLASIALIAWRIYRPLVPAVPKSGEPFQIPMLEAEEIERRAMLEQASAGLLRLEGEVQALRKELRASELASSEAWNAAFKLIKGEQTDRAVAVVALAKEYAGYVQDTRTAAAQLEDIVKALAERELAEYRKREIDRWAGGLDNAWTDLVRLLKDPRPFTDRSWTQEYKPVQDGWTGYASEIASIAELATGVRPSLLEHPNYTRNPQVPAEDEDEISEPAKLQEYRRLSDERATLREGIRQIIFTLHSTANQAQNRIFAYVHGNPLSRRSEAQ